MGSLKLGGLGFGLWGLLGLGAWTGAGAGAWGRRFGIGFAEGHGD